MKFSFSDNLVKSSSFIELCNFVQSYGFDGVEISDVKKEISQHVDSIFRSSITVDAKRKLVNRHISIPVIAYPSIIDENTDANDVIKYLEFASLASASGIVIKMESVPNNLYDILLPSVRFAEENGVSILIETYGVLKKTEKVLEIINEFGSASIKVCWDVRETFFNAGESRLP